MIRMPIFRDQSLRMRICMEGNMLDLPLACPAALRQRGLRLILSAEHAPVASVCLVIYRLL